MSLASAVDAACCNSERNSAACARRSFSLIRPSFVGPSRSSCLIQSFKRSPSYFFNTLAIRVWPLAVRCFLCDKSKSHGGNDLNKCLGGRFILVFVNHLFQ